MTTSGRSGEPVLRVDIAQLSRGGARVLGEVAFDVGRGETVALVGPSGVGKSSLLRAVAGLDGAYEGIIAAPARIGMIFQEPTLLPWRTLVDNLTIAAHVTRDAAERTLASVGLGGRGDDYPGQLSLGQQRRMALARAFAVRPDLLLMDEPFVSLDPKLVDEMMSLFLALRDSSGVAALLVTHVEEEAERLAARIVTLGGAPATVTGVRAVG